MIPNLKIISTDKPGHSARFNTDVYSGDTRLLDVYSLSITVNAAGSLVVASSIQGFVYEGPARLSVDWGFRQAVKNSTQRRDLPDDRVANVRIEASRRFSFAVIDLDSGEQIERVTGVSINIAHGKHDVTVSYLVPLQGEG